MQTLRCPCKKIVCQISQDSIIIKCRHCKRYIQIKTKWLVGIEHHLKDPTQYFESEDNSIAAQEVVSR